MKKTIALTVFLLYLSVILVFRIGGARIRDALSYQADVMYMFYYESETMHSMFTLTVDCVHYDAETGEPFLYILEEAKIPGDEGAYIIVRVPVSVRETDGRYLSVVAPQHQQSPVVLTPVAEDKVGKRAVIARICYDNGYEEE